MVSGFVSVLDFSLSRRLWDNLKVQGFGVWIMGWGAWGPQALSDFL